MSCLWLLQATESVNEAKKLDPSSINTLFMLFKLALAGSNVEQGLCTAYLMVLALLVGRKCFACTHWNLIFSDHSKGRPTEHVQWGSQAGEYRQGKWGSETDLPGRFYGLWGTSLSNFHLNFKFAKTSWFNWPWFVGAHKFLVHLSLVWNIFSLSLPLPG